MIMECKKCKGTEFYKEQRGPHLGVYCNECGTWQCWEKHTTNPKTAQEYKEEYMDKEKATPKQMRTLGFLIGAAREKGMSKLAASKLIDILMENQ
jgi:hypothetical protein